MQIGCALLSAEEIGLSKSIGFDYVELMGKYLVSLTDLETKKLIVELDKNETSCLGINAYCPKEIVIAGPGYNLKDAKQYAEKCANVAKQIGTRKIGIGSPNSRNLPKGYSRDLARKQVIEFLKVTSEPFEKYGITICLEALATCYCNYINTIQEAVDIIQTINSENIRVVMDFYNMEHMGEADIELQHFLPYVVHAHISDDDGAINRRYFLKEEKKAIHQKRVKTLYDNGYQDTFSIEVDLPINIDKATKSINIIREIIK